MANKQTVVVIGFLVAMVGLGLGVVMMILLSGESANEAEAESLGNDTESPSLAFEERSNEIPNLQFDGLAGGAGTTTEALVDGTPMVINLWASWCPHCLAEMPELQAFHDAAGGTVRMIGVNTQDRVDAAEAFIAENNITFPIYRDAVGQFQSATGSRGLPATYLVNGEGEIVYIHSGGIDAERLVALCDQYLNVDVTL